ncbi:MAG: M48 family metalloprotease [Thermoanaerobaculia bacterium]|nr:M48 family metalloprotease [Thermoanaerobaculia bacterium]
MNRRRLSLMLILLALPLVRCATNPATGEAQLAFYGTDTEIEMGAKADADIVRSLGLLPDEELQEYVDDLGQRLARTSERPELPWTFRVLDSPVVNAFALPGGYVYITRGMIQHLNSEAQLVAVLGHEIGHITGRHGVEQMSRAQLAQFGMMAALLASEDVRRYGGYLQQSLGLLFLKFGRDDETEADQLGLRYMTRHGYNPWEMESVFQTLDHVRTAAGLGTIPDWLSTHPSPQNRIEEIGRVIDSFPLSLRQGLVARTDLLDRIEGMVYGDNPREGYFVGGDFFHPDLRFKVSFPAGWTTRNEKSRAFAVSPDDRTIVMLTTGEGETVAEAKEAFFDERGVGGKGEWIDGYWYFTAGSAEGSFTGLVGFIEHEGVILQLMGFGRENGFSRYRDEIEHSITSLRPLDDEYYLDVEPMRIELVPIIEGMSVREFDEIYPGAIEPDELAVLNGLPDESGYLEPGRIVKRVLPGRTVGSSTGEQGVEY